MSKVTIKAFQKNILGWFAKNGRRDLPWRPPALKLRRDGTYDPYKILVSEVMLQQTQVDRVKEYYSTFLNAFPTPSRLAHASPAEVLRIWKGLGYNRRALYLKRAAETIAHDYRGRVPRDVCAIEKFPGVGHYTARAVAVFAFNQPHVFIETNIRRVFIHFFGDLILAPFVIPNERRLERDGSRRIYAGHHATQIPPLPSVGRNDSCGSLDNKPDPAGLRRQGIRAGLLHKMSDPLTNISVCSSVPGGFTCNKVSDSDLLPFIEKALYKENPGLWYNALMDYGALALSDVPNPNRKSRHYTKQSRFEGSRRYARAKILDYLLRKSATTKELERYFITDPYLEHYRKSIDGILEALASEGFIERKPGRWEIK